MNKINCPVCQRADVEGNVCPNCETDLSSLRLLMELSPVVDNPTPTNRRGLLLGLALLLLILGIVLGTIASNLFPRSLLPVTESSPVIPPVREPITPPKEVTKTVCVDGFKYTVRSGDSLSRIAKRFYGDESLLSPILEANSFLLDRPDSLEVGEKLFIPNSDKSC
jgi:hypothetical protein